MTDFTFKQNPYPYYAWMREHSPVYQAFLTRKQPVYIISRYADVAAALKDERLVKSPRNVGAGKAGQPWMPKVLRPLLTNMLDSDDPDHKRLRTLVHKAFTPRMISKMQTRIDSLSHELLDAAFAKSKVDLVTDYALPLPLTIIAEILGIPTEDNAKFHKWSASITSVNPTPLNMIKVIPTIMSYFRYLRGMFAERRRNPQDDLLTALVQAEEDGDKLSEDELLAMVFILLVAGHETTVNLISSGTLSLLQNRDQLDLLRTKPELLGSAIEEFLRYDGPLETATERYAREPITLEGVTIPEGAMVLAGLASANRDATVFDNPDTLDITREKNKHMAFGLGIHYCLGAPLARMEGRIAFQNLLSRSPDLRLAVSPDQLRYKSTMVLRSLEGLPVHL